MSTIDVRMSASRPPCLSVPYPVALSLRAPSCCKKTATKWGKRLCGRVFRRTTGQGLLGSEPAAAGGGRDADGEEARYPVFANALLCDVQEIADRRQTPHIQKGRLSDALCKRGFAWFATACAADDEKSDRESEYAAPASHCLLYGMVRWTGVARRGRTREVTPQNCKWQVQARSQL